MKPNFHVAVCYWHSTTVSLKTRMLFSIWAKTFLAFIVSRYEPSSLRMRIGNANVASTELGTMLKRKSRMKTHLDSFGIRHFHNLSPKDKLDICKIKGFICGTTSCNGRYANGENVLRLSRAFPPESGGGPCVRFPFRSDRSLPRLLETTSKSGIHCTKSKL